jgi:hypothetical protein
MSVAQERATAAAPVSPAEAGLPGFVWLLIGSLLLLALAGAGFWAGVLAGAPAAEFANPTWVFLCH